MDKSLEVTKVSSLCIIINSKLYKVQKTFKLFILPSSCVTPGNHVLSLPSVIYVSLKLNWDSSRCVSATLSSIFSTGHFHLFFLLCLSATYFNYWIIFELSYLPQLKKIGRKEELSSMANEMSTTPMYQYSLRFDFQWGHNLRSLQLVDHPRY